MKKIITIILFTGIFCHVGNAQEKSVAHNNNLWFFQLSKYYFNNGFGIENELHLRLTDWGAEKQQILIRPSLFYKVNDAITFHLGYTHLETYPYGEQPIAIQTPENNVWVQVTLNHESAGLKFSHRYRFEERWQGKTAIIDAEPQIDGYQHKNRLRYRLTIKKNLGESGYLAAFNEIWLDVGENTGTNRYDQNWTYIGYGRKLNHLMNIELGYLYQWLAKADGVRFEYNNTIQLALHLKFSQKNI